MRPSQVNHRDVIERSFCAVVANEDKLAFTPRQLALASSDQPYLR